jgi:hypothetical protein
MSKPIEVAVNMIAVPEDLHDGIAKALQGLYDLGTTVKGVTNARNALLRYHAFRDGEGEFAPKAGETAGYEVKVNPLVWKRAGDVMPGDRLDLENDRFADTDPEGDTMDLQFELYVVEETALETIEGQAGIVFYSSTSGHNFAFPVDHLVKFDSVDFGLTPLAEPAIRATCWSDDRNVEIAFDATEFFAVASDGAIMALNDAHFERSGEADSVAEFYRDGTTKKLYGYSDAMGQDCGFEVAIERDTVMTWLAVHRPELYRELGGE